MKKIISVILCSVLIFILAACGKSNVKQDNKSTTTVKEEANKEIETKVTEKTKVEDVKPVDKVSNDAVKGKEVLVYFSDEQAMQLVGVKRNIINPTAKSIVEELIKGPGVQVVDTAKLYPTLPVDLEVIDVLVKDNIAYVNFKSSVTQKMQGGSTGEGMALFSIINTLALDTDLGITKVQFLIEGKKVDSIKGHYDVSLPMSENKEMIKK